MKITLLEKLNIDPPLTPDQAAGLEYVLSLLPKLLYEIIALHYYENMSFSNISKNSGFTPDQIRQGLC